MQLAKVKAQDACEFSEYSTTKAWAEHGSYQRMETGAGVAQTPKFDGLNSWAILWHQYDTRVEHKGWTPGDKAAYLIAALNMLAAHST
jgi:hypothetical protein